MLLSKPSRLEVWLLVLLASGLGVFVSLKLSVRQLGPHPSPLVPRAGESRIAFGATPDALEKYRLFKMEKAITWLTPETRVVVRLRGTAASFVEVASGEQKGRVGYVEAALVDDGWR